MLAYDAETRTNLGLLHAFCEPPAAIPFESHDSRHGVDRDGMGLAALVDTPLASRFCAWRGRSGRRYIFSVYPWPACPAFCHALLLAVIRDDVGRRRALSIVDTGEFPEPVLLRAKRNLCSFGATLEFHMHLLASSAPERAATLADLAVHCEREPKPDPSESAGKGAATR